MKRLKFYLIGIGLLCTILQASGIGVGGELSFVNPNSSHDLGVMVKPAPSIALTIRHTNETRFRWGVSFGYVPFKTTGDDFWTLDENGEVAMLSFHLNKYNYYYGGGVSEFKILDRPLSPVVGLDFRINIAQFRLDYKGEGYLSGEYKQESLSLLPKAGIVYDMNERLSALLTAGYNFDIWSNAPFGEKLFPYLTVSATLIYYFE